MAQVNFKLDSELKKSVEEIAGNLGLATSDVIRVFLKKFVLTRGFPFAVQEEVKLQSRIETQPLETVEKAMEKFQSEFL
ncbi:hypothetical protein AGMMS49938_08690 [Fibrobacterales bacterium]|nr:hypothetical protein AGMMS49938_08690 [Fibrobacterales bacterium]